jgi:DNA-binding transcriptional regulator GbsR (MarR family)
MLSEPSPSTNADSAGAYERALEQFVLYWGEMASAWGINKTMAQIHALLYAEQEPLDTDTIMARLDISRGNANMNLHNLMQWGLVYRIQQQGSRKDFFTAEKDVWNTAARIIKERQEREVAPIRKNVMDCLAILETDAHPSKEQTELKNRLQKFVEFLDVFQDFAGALLPYVREKNVKSLRKFVMLAKARNLLRTKPEDILPWPDDESPKP